jgi:hypothetical protein
MLSPCTAPLDSDTEMRQSHGHERSGRLWDRKAYASFLVGAVDNASMTYADEPDYHTQAFNVYAG